MKPILLYTITNLLVTFSFSTGNSNFIIGKWITKSKDVSIQIMRKDNLYCGKIKWFDDPKQNDEDVWTDYNNPNEKLRERKLYGLKVLDKLSYNKNGFWSGGLLYDPSTGNTYKCQLKKINELTIEIRAYWGLPIFGRTIIFTKD